jgi:coenzyme PQQ biosynthesis protein C
MSADELEARLRDIGARRYHRLHPFHALLHGGKCSKGQVQAWALNRYYYQAMIPVKDASLIARCDDPALRREWRSRLVDHDGERDGDGGIACWLKLTDGLGLDRDYVVSLAGLLPATRFAVEAYVHFVRDKSLLEAVASSLTELFAPEIISDGFCWRCHASTLTTRSPPDKPLLQAARDLTCADCVSLAPGRRGAQRAVPRASGVQGAPLGSARRAGKITPVGPNVPPGVRLCRRSNLNDSRRRPPYHWAVVYARRAPGSQRSAGRTDARGGAGIH